MKTDIIVNSALGFRQIARDEPEWLYGLRKKSWESYNDQPLPEKTANVWRYTSPEYFLTREPIENAKMNSSTADAVNSSKFNGSGVIFRSLESAATQNADLVQKYLGRLIAPGFGKFEAYNMALWNKGMLLYVPDNVVLEEPIFLDRHPGGPFAVERFLAIIGANSQVTIIDNYDGNSSHDSPNVNSVIEIFGGDSSRIKYLNLQRLGPTCTSYFTQRAEIGRSTKIDSIYAGLGSAISKFNAGVILNGKGGESRMYGILTANDQQHLDYHTMHHHKGSETLSNINFRVVLNDRATSAYTGLIRIEKETANCEAYQENRNLLLSKGSRAESIPELEILTDQVRCTHGATMGSIDREILFYLKSRGIKHEDAVRIIVSGFMEPTITQMPADLQNLIRKSAESKLEKVTR